MADPSSLPSTAPVPGAAAVAGAVLATAKVVEATATLNAPTTNKSTASGAAGVVGTALGTAVVAILDQRYHLTLSVEMSGLIVGAVATVAAWIGAFFMPLITAAQTAALRKLEAEK